MAHRYLVIENEGVADLQNFLLLGVSSARDEETQIGQFGSGAKHGILIALRAGLEVHVVTPDAHITPQLRDITVNNKLHQQVIFNVTNGNGSKQVESSMTLGFGELDWKTNLRAMLREFISNSLDAVGPTDINAWDRIKIYIDNQVGAAADKTRVFIEFRDDVRHEFAEIESLFLHATKRHTQSVLQKDEPSPMKMYRKGVFVRCEDESELNSIFDYNAGDNVKIDESRSMDSGDLRKCAADTLFSETNTAVQNVQTILRECVGNNKEYWESHFSSWYLGNYASIVAKAVKALWGENVVIVDDLRIFSQCISRLQGAAKVIYFPAHMINWCNVASYYCRTARDVLDINVAKLRNIKKIEAPLVHQIIEALHSSGHIDKESKPVPNVYRFTGMVEGEAMLRGLATEDSIYLCHEDTDNITTILEELGHYYTGAGDFTRDFQCFAFSVAGWYLKEHLR